MQEKINQIQKIIVPDWSECMIWDVLDWYQQEITSDVIQTWDKIVYIYWLIKRKPLSEQSNQCINYIHWLLSEK